METTNYLRGKDKFSEEQWVNLLETKINNLIEKAKTKRQCNKEYLKQMYKMPKKTPYAKQEMIDIDYENLFLEEIINDLIVG